MTSLVSGMFLAIMAELVIHWFSEGTKAEEANLYILGGYFTEATEKSGSFSQPCAWLLTEGGGWWLLLATREIGTSSLFGFLFFLTLNSFWITILVIYCFITNNPQLSDIKYPLFFFLHAQILGVKSLDRGMACLHDVLVGNLSWKHPEAADDSNAWGLASSGTFYTHLRCPG